MFGSKEDSIDQKKTNTVLKSLQNLSDANLTVYLILTFCNFVLKYANTSSGMFQNLKSKF